MVTTNINKVFCTCSVAFFKADSSLGTDSSNGCVSPGPGYDKNNTRLNLISLDKLFLSSRNKQGKKKSKYNAITLLESSTGNGTTRHLIRRSNKNDP